MTLSDIRRERCEIREEPRGKRPSTENLEISRFENKRKKNGNNEKETKYVEMRTERRATCWTVASCLKDCTDGSLEHNTKKNNKQRGEDQIEMT